MGDPATDSELPAMPSDSSPLADPPQSWQSFRRTVTRFESEKIALWPALRNALGVSIPLAAGVLAGAVSNGLVIGTGALNVSFSDGDDPYRQRARRMLA